MTKKSKPTLFAPNGHPFKNARTKTCTKCNGSCRIRKTRSEMKRNPRASRFKECPNCLGSGYTRK